MTRNEAYWDKTRIPKLQKLVVTPMPEATTRLAALRSGQVDWIEVPPPDAIPSLKTAGFQISLWPYPHTWPYIFKLTEGSAFNDRRLHRARFYALYPGHLLALLHRIAPTPYGLLRPPPPRFCTRAS